MDNKNNLDSTNKYVQGSVWKWVNSLEKRAGVQSSERPVLIISNNTFNNFSLSINCVSITSVLKESPVHVPLYIIVDSHIQCEQIHTVPKTELIEFIGIVPNSTLSQVKAKIRIQFDMSTDRNTEMFNSIKKSLDELNAKTEPETLNNINANLEVLNEKANRGFGIPAIEEDYLRLISI